MNKMNSLHLMANWLTYKAPHAS